MKRAGQIVQARGCGYRKRKSVIQKHQGNCVVVVKEHTRLCKCKTGKLYREVVMEVPPIVEEPLGIHSVWKMVSPFSLTV